MLKCKYLIILLTLYSFSLYGRNKKILFNKNCDSIAASEVQQGFIRTKNQNIHPRLFFNKTDIRKIKNLIISKDKIETLGYEQLRKSADKILTEKLYNYQLDAANLRIPAIHKFATEVPSLILMYQLTGNRKYADRCYKQLEIFMNFPDWGANRHFLDTGIAAFDFAFAYDGLYEYFTDNQRRSLREAVLKNILYPAKKQMDTNNWWHTNKFNWNGICNGGVIMAALALYENDEKLMSNIIALAANGLHNYINAFEPDGQSEEGIMYWGYGLMYSIITFESLHNVIGTAFDLDTSNGFKKTGWFPFYISGPVSSLCFGDDPVKNCKTQSFFWFAKHFQDVTLAKFQYNLCIENKKVSWEDMLYYDPALIKQSSNKQVLSTENYIHGIEVMSLRDNFNSDGFFVSMHGGKNTANHGHLDAGSFDIQAMGEVWAYGDLGSDNYTFPGYFSKNTLPDYFDDPSNQKIPGRWHFYRLRAEGKNCLVFNPSVCPDQNPIGEAIVSSYISGKIQNSFTLDLSDCYKRDVIKYTREITLNKFTKAINIKDVYITRKSSIVWWGMHTKANIHIQNNGKVALLYLNNKTLKIIIKSPINANFQILDATYLPGESFPLTQNSDNKEYKKLAIKLENQLSNKITIEILPIRKIKSLN